MNAEDIRNSVTADDEDFAQEYNEMLDMNYEEIVVTGISFSPSQVLKECDPIAYTEDFNNWLDSYPTPYECTNCGVLYEDEDEAEECCQEED